MADILRLQANVPEVIAVEFTDGLPVKSNYGGDQIMFSLSDGRRIFLPPFAAKKIADSGVKPKEHFEICKRDVSVGNRRTVEYHIDLIAPPPPPPAPAPVAAPRIHAVAAPMAQAVEAQACESPMAQAMKQAGIAAIDAVLEIEQHARNRGMTDFEFGSENIQKFAVTIFIETRRGGRN